jgi:hypothetical protein
MKYLFLLLLFIHAGFGNAENREHGTIPDLPFYEVELNGTVSYILGTIHFGVDIGELPKFVIGALEQKSIFVTESLDSSEKKSVVQDGFATLSANTQELLKVRGIGREDFNSYRPQTICKAYLYWDYLKDNNSGVMDAQLERVARESGKILKELDVAQELTSKAIEQLFSPCGIESTISQYPPSIVSQLVRESVSKRAEQYKFGGERSLANGSGVPESTLERNESWLPLLVKMHSQGYFAVVGAGHLDPFHPRGLLSLLRAKGFKITRVSSSRSP